jgi:hypothetical protein
MGVSRITALIIQTRGKDVVCDVGGPSEEDKYYGLISLHRNGEFDHDLLSTEPIFNTKEQALIAMQDTVKQIRSITLPAAWAKDLTKDE